MISFFCVHLVVKAHKLCKNCRICDVRVPPPVLKCENFLMFRCMSTVQFNIVFYHIGPALRLRLEITSRHLWQVSHSKSFFLPSCHYYHVSPRHPGLLNLLSESKYEREKHACNLVLFQPVCELRYEVNPLWIHGKDFMNLLKMCVIFNHSYFTPPPRARARTAPSHSQFNPSLEQIVRFVL